LKGINKIVTKVISEFSIDTLKHRKEPLTLGQSKGISHHGSITGNFESVVERFESERWKRCYFWDSNTSLV